MSDLSLDKPTHQARSHSAPRRNLAGPSVVSLVLCFGVPTAASAAVAAATPAPAIGCRPVIEHSSVFKPGPGPGVTFTGKCFGTDGSFTGDNRDFRVYDLGQTGSQGVGFYGGAPLWGACWEHATSQGELMDTLTCAVPEWTNTSITFASFGAEYGKPYVVRVADTLEIIVTNPNTGLPTATGFYVTAGVPGIYVVTGGGGTSLAGTDRCAGRQPFAHRGSGHARAGRHSTGSIFVPSSFAWRATIGSSVGTTNRISEMDRFSRFISAVGGQRVRPSPLLCRRA